MIFTCFLGCKYEKNTQNSSWLSNWTANQQKKLLRNSFFRICIFRKADSHKTNQISLAGLFPIAFLLFGKAILSPFWKNAKNESAHQKPPKIFHSDLHRTI